MSWYCLLRVPRFAWRDGIVQSYSTPDTLTRRIAEAIDEGARRLHRTRGIVGFSACALFYACASQPAGHQDLLAFLEGERVTRDEVYSHLGEPFAKYEQSRVVTYRLSQNKQGYFESPPTEGWEGVQYDLVLVFDERDRVERHTLVSIRPAH